MDLGTNTATERHFANRLGKLFYYQNRCDVHFQFNCGQSVGAHVLILFAGSPVFAAMFQSDLLEAQTGKVDIVDYEIDVFRQLMICLYTGRAPKLSDKTMTSLLFQAADKNGVETLKNECLDELLSQLRIGNAIEMLVWSHFNSVPKLFEYAMEIFVDILAGYATNPNGTI
jgi:speckle-type POZ protein